MENIFTPFLLLIFFVVLILSMQFRGKRSRKSFDKWHETHFLITEFILENRDGDSEVSKIDDDFGTDGLIDLSKSWTDEFEAQMDGKLLNTLDNYDAINEFCKSKNK